MLTKPCDFLSGVGPTSAKKLAKCGILTIQDLLFHLPYRYQDRTHITPIQDIRPNDWCVVMARVCKTEIKYGKRKMLDCYVEDKTGILKLRFFHFNQQQVKNLRTGVNIRAFGEVREFANSIEMIHPEYKLLETGEETFLEETLTPIYPTTQGLSQNRLRQFINSALKASYEELEAIEWMNQNQRAHYGFPTLCQALDCLHNPPPDVVIHTLEEATHPALRRLIFDELLAQQLSMQLARKHRTTIKAPAFSPADDLQARCLTHLPFQLTGAQQRVIAEINNDLNQDKPMLRLVQGDVGAGKTVVAAFAALQAIANGYQVALMAPTDILSEQHLQTLKTWLSPLAISVERISGKMRVRERKAVLTALANHQCQIIVGTHALFQEEVRFARLGLVIIDEQHRFGVEQRLLLQQKGQTHHSSPHQLLMTATPIPRTLAMSQLAHIDISILDELPPGRTAVITSVMNQEKRLPLIMRLQAAIAEKRQVYWVCTLVEESEKLQCIAATACAQNLQEQLPNARVGLVHGRMKADEKETLMAAFKAGEIDLLVATTVIEVGVDVPNASLMIIENAERLGLSQLHQLRGRVGRGSVQSHCLLLYQSPLSNTATERLHLMRATNDGFVIAEKDLELRGAGEILGTRQTGYRPFKIADLQRDKALLPQIMILAQEIIKEAPETAQNITKRWLGNFEPFLQG